MPRTIEIRCGDSHSAFNLIKLDRAKLYGSRQRIPVDHAGRPCAGACLTADGQYILAKGSTSVLNLDSNFDMVERNDMQAVDADGIQVQVMDSTLGAPHGLGQPVEPETLLEYDITHVYALSPISISMEFEKCFAHAAAYRIAFKYAAGYNLDDSFIVKSDAGFFILCGKRTGFEFAGYDDADLSIPADDENLAWDDDLDFVMM